jgi:hypothetical protein
MFCTVCRLARMAQHRAGRAFEASRLGERRALAGSSTAAPRAQSRARGRAHTAPAGEKRMRVLRTRVAFRLAAAALLRCCRNGREERASVGVGARRLGRLAAREVLDKSGRFRAQSNAMPCLHAWDECLRVHSLASLPESGTSSARSGQRAPPRSLTPWREGGTPQTSPDMNGAASAQQLPSFRG